MQRLMWKQRHAHMIYRGDEILGDSPQQDCWSPQLLADEG
jgi:hypothetical protein